MKRKELLLLLLVVNFASSCNKLDIEPDDFLSPNQAYNTEKQLDRAIGGAYDILRAGGGYHYQLGVILAASDERYPRQGLGLSTGPGVFDYAPTEGGFSALWSLR